MHVKPVVLVILDGFGHNPQKEFNAIAQAKTPTLNHLFTTYPHTTLQASGVAVGLREGYIGNSEVGHLTIGSGRVVEQPASYIHRAIVDKSFFKNPVLIQSLDKLKQSGAPLHILGLLSDAGVHSDIEQLYAFLDVAHQRGIKYVFIHLILDGRDTPPKSAPNYLAQLDDALTALEYGSIGSLHGRFYAMDRDGNWDRIKRSYRVLTDRNLDCTPQHWETALEEQYAQGITDEFLKPVRLDPTSTIEPGDGVIFFNFRADRARELTAAFVDPNFTHFPREPLPLTCFITPTEYSSALKTNVMFPHKPVPNTLKELLARAGKTVFSIAETEKYAHVTYFFGGGQEREFPGETRVLIKSLVERNYMEHPHMSAHEITQATLQSLANDPKDFYLINYANADMVAHSGNLQATTAAIECLDEQIKALYEAVVTNMDGTLIITADHGNAEQMQDQRTTQPKTAHTTNPVPIIIASAHLAGSSLPCSLHSLADIAPCILRFMHIPVPNRTHSA